MTRLNFLEDPAPERRKGWRQSGQLGLAAFPRRDSEEGLIYHSAGERRGHWGDTKGAKPRPW